MAVTPLTISSVNRSTGLLQALAAANTDGSTIVNDGKVFLIVANADGSPTNVTVAWGVNGAVDGVTPTARVIAVANATTRIIGPFPPSSYNDATGLVTFTFSKVTSLTVQAVKLDPAI